MKVHICNTLSLLIISRAHSTGHFNIFHTYSGNTAFAGIHCTVAVLPRRRCSSRAACTRESLLPACVAEAPCCLLCCVAVPAPPSLVTKVLNGSVIQATWEPSTKMGQHQGFRLYYRRAHTPHFAGPFTFPRNVSQHTITELGETRRFRRHPHACVTAPSRTSRLSLKESDPFLPPASESGDQTGVVVPEEILSRG